MRPVAHQPISFVQDGSIPVPVPEPPLGYGLLYNWYAATDERGIAPDGWRVASDTDLTTLQTELGGFDVAGGKMKSTRTDPDLQPRWDAPNISADNSSSFNALPPGQRSDSGAYSELGRLMRFHISNDTANTIIWSLQSSGGVFTKNQFFPAKQWGFSIRCLRDTTPPSPTVTDADGNAYTWVQIGAQYWLAQNLRTTKYNNGDDIPTGLDNATWSAATSGAWAYPNGDATLPI